MRTKCRKKGKKENLCTKKIKKSSSKGKKRIFKLNIHRNSEVLYKIPQFLMETFFFLKSWNETQFGTKIRPVKNL